MNNTTTVSLSLGTIQIIMIILKLANVLAVSWWVVFIPAFIELFVLIIVITYFLWIMSKLS